MSNTVKIHQRYNIIKSDYKLIEKIFSMHTRKRITESEFKSKLPRLQERILSSFSTISNISKAIEEQTAPDIKYFIAEHLLISNLDLGKKYAKHHKIKIEFDLFEYVKNICDELRKSNYNPGLDFCKDNRLLLKTLNVCIRGYEIPAINLETLLKIFMFADYCKKDAHTEAMSFVRENYSIEFKKYLVLLVCKNIEVKNEYDINNINDLCDFLSETIYLLHGISSVSRLTRRVAFGLVAYKTKVCGNEPNCPACLKSLHGLRDKLPYCRRDVSIILCSGSKKEASGENQAYCFSSGYVYCEGYISSLDYVYTCKVTGVTSKDPPKICYFV